jgi:tetratricopeptide (TPR) repeat protein
MTSYSKAFVSHSSTDKALVNEVIKEIPAARWEIDTMTFEEGKTSASEIEGALSRSDLFVLFASQRALEESGWIESELEIAQQLYFKKSIRGIQVFIIDETPIKQLPTWVRMHVVATTHNVVRIANTIKARLIQLDSSLGLAERPYISRSTLRNDLEQKISNIATPIRAIYLSGIDGIGRRTFVASSLKDIYPGSNVIGIVIPMSIGEGLLEAYHKLYIEWRRPTRTALNDFMARANSLKQTELVNEMVGLVNEVGDSKSYVWLQFGHSVVDDDGSIDTQFEQLLTTMDSARPTLIITATRLPRFVSQRHTPNVAYLQVGSLSEPESRRLWSFALSYFSVKEIDEEMIQFLSEHISGHPNLIWMAAEFVAQTGIAAVKANVRQFSETLNSLSMSLIDGLPLSDNAKRILSLFDEFGAIAAEDLVTIYENDEDLANAITVLLSYSLLEADESHLRLAPYFQHARIRKTFSADGDKFLKTARTRLLTAVSNYQLDESVSFTTIDSAVMASIKEEKALPLQLDEKAIVGSHYLRVARSYYDQEDYDSAIKFCDKAFDKCYTLTQSASIETLRLLGMSAARKNKSAYLEKAITELQKIGTPQASRHIHFIKGFEARWNGQIDTAETEFRKALNLNSEDTHVLRELSQILLTREDFREAESLARRAMQGAKAKINPYLIDILLQCLIEQKKRNIEELREDSEVRDLFIRLQVADAREKSSFYPLRRAQLFAALKEPSEALKYADEAVRSNVQQLRAYATRAEIKLTLKHDAQLLASTATDIKEVERLASASEDNRRHLALIAKLHIRYELARDDPRAARNYFDRMALRLGKLRDVLAAEIAGYIVDQRIADSDLIKWANIVLAKK